MQVCLFVYDGSEEPPGLRDYLRKHESFEVSIRTWLVAHPGGPATLYSEIQRVVLFECGFVVVPLERQLAPIHSQATTPNADALDDWLAARQDELRRSL